MIPGVCVAAPGPADSVGRYDCVGMYVNVDPVFALAVMVDPAKGFAVNVDPPKGFPVFDFWAVATAGDGLTPATSGVMLGKPPPPATAVGVDVAPICIGVEVGVGVAEGDGNTGKGVLDDVPLDVPLDVGVPTLVGVVDAAADGVRVGVMEIDGVPLMLTLGRFVGVLLPVVVPLSDGGMYVAVSLWTT